MNLNSFDVKFIRNTVFVALAIFVLLATTTDPIVLVEKTNEGEGISINLSFLWLFASIAYILFSFRWWKTKVTIDDKTIVRNGYIEADEYGVRKVFGNPTDTLGSGLPFVPLEICQLEYLPASTQQVELPGEPREIYRGEMKDPTELPLGKVPPNRVTFRDSVNEDDAKNLMGDEYEIINENGRFKFEAEAPEDGLARRVTAEVVVVVRWRILQEGAIKFVKSITSVKEANRQLEDELFGVINRLLPLMSVAQAKQNFRWISEILRIAAEKRIRFGKEGDWGVKIEGAFIKMIPLNHDLNTSIALAAEADFKGRGEKELIELKGAGIAKAAHDLEKETLVGRTAGLVALAKDLGIKGDVAIAQFVAGQLASGPGTIILGAEGLGQVAGIGAALVNKLGDKSND